MTKNRRSKQELERIIREAHEKRISLEKTAHKLNSLGFKTPSKGVDWTRVTVSSYAVRHMGLVRRADFRNHNKRKMIPTRTRPKVQLLGLIEDIMTSNIDDKHKAQLIALAVSNQ